MQPLQSNPAPQSSRTSQADLVIDVFTVFAP